MEPGETTRKWEGKVSEKLRGARAEQVWPLLQDFFNLHKYFPNLATCRGLQGVSGEPGCVRYCAGSTITSTGQTAMISWSTERLVGVDPVQRSLSYEIVDCNIGFKSYVATMQVKEDEEGCAIEWSFEVEPVKGWELEDLVSKYQVGLQGMARRIEDVCINIRD